VIEFPTDPAEMEGRGRVITSMLTTLNQKCTTFYWIHRGAEHTAWQD